MFINDYMYYYRVKGPQVNWNALYRGKHRYSRCIIEITYKGDKLEFLAEKNVLFEEIVKFIEENESFFRSSTIIIQFEADISKVDELKSCYDENTAKSNLNKSI